MFQISPRNRLAFRMAAEPACAVTQQLFNFVVADPIMLVVVEHRDQHVQMRKQIAYAAIGLKFYAEILAFAPLRKFVVQREPSRRHRVSERFAKPLPRRDMAERRLLPSKAAGTRPMIGAPCCDPPTRCRKPARWPR